MAEQTPNEARWLERTPVANYDDPSIQTLVASRRWTTLSPYDRIGAAYTFVKDEIRFGYNRSDDLVASEVLRDGYGQCNTKGNLLVALLRALGIPTRFHGFTINKALQKGAIPSWLFPLAPARILHSWVEVQWDGKWLPLEGFILDKDYLRSVQERFPDAKSFCGFGVATEDLQNPNVEWSGSPTYIQREGIAEDFGVFDHPDDLYATRGTNLSGLRRFLYTYVFRHTMNATVAQSRRRTTRDTCYGHSSPTTPSSEPPTARSALTSRSPIASGALTPPDTFGCPAARLAPPTRRPILS